VHLLNQTEWNRIPTVIHLHGPLVMFAHTMGWPDLNSEFYRTGTAMEGTCLRLADAVFSSSRCSADWCARHYGVDRATVPILHVGVDTRLFAPQNVPKARRPTILFVGKLARNKGIMLLLEAACALAHEIPDLRLRVIGGGDDALVSSLRKTAAAAGKPDLLELVGFVTRDNLPLELSRVHVFAAPSMYEGGPGFVYLEAMACGLPVVACEGSGAAEVITDHESGLLVPPNDLVALVVALRWLLADPPARQVMGERARRHVIETADSAVCLKRIEEFYKEVIARAKPVS
jgi:starch synthase